MLGLCQGVMVKFYWLRTPVPGGYGLHLFVLQFHLISTEEGKESDALQGDCLDFLVNFCTQVKDAGLLDEVFPETEGKEPETESKEPKKNVDGAKPKVAPPLKLDGSMKPPEPKGPPPCLASSVKAQAAASSKHAFQLPSVPEEPGASTQGRLVVTPNQMKQFLYGTQQQTNDSASSSSMSQPVPGNN